MNEARLRLGIGAAEIKWCRWCGGFRQACGVSCEVCGGRQITRRGADEIAAATFSNHHIRCRADHRSARRQVIGGAGLSHHGGLPHALQFGIEQRGIDFTLAGIRRHQQRAFAKVLGDGRQTVDAHNRQIQGNAKSPSQ